MRKYASCKVRIWSHAQNKADGHSSRAGNPSTGEAETVDLHGWLTSCQPNLTGKPQVPKRDPVSELRWIAPKKEHGG